MPTITVYVNDEIYRKLPKDKKSEVVQAALNRHLFFDKEDWKERVMAILHKAGGPTDPRDILDAAFEELSK